MIVLIEDDGSVTLLAREDADVEDRQTVDGTRRTARVTAATASRSSGGADRVYAAIAAEVVGLSQRALDMTLEYVKERKQFGVPVGSFQAVGHRCAEMLRARRVGAVDGVLRRLGGRRGPGASARGGGAGRGRGGRRRPRGDGVGDPGARRHRLHLGGRRPLDVQAGAGRRGAARRRAAAPGDAGADRRGAGGGGDGGLGRCRVLARELGGAQLPRLRFSAVVDCGLLKVVGTGMAWAGTVPTSSWGLAGTVIAPEGHLTVPASRHRRCRHGFRPSEPGCRRTVPANPERRSGTLGPRLGRPAVLANRERRSEHVDRPPSPPSRTHPSRPQ